jgi:hypothetical protein
MLDHLVAWSGIAGLALTLIFGAGPHMGLKIAPKVARLGFYAGIILLAASPLIFLIQEQKTGAGTAQNNNINSNAINVPGNNNRVTIAPNPTISISETEISRRRQVLSSLVQLCKAKKVASSELLVDCINNKLIAAHDNFQIRPQRAIISGNSFKNIKITGARVGFSFHGDMIGNEFEGIEFDAVETPFEVK